MFGVERIAGSEKQQTGLWGFPPGDWALSLQSSTQNKQELTDGALDSTPLQGGQVSHTAKRVQFRLKVSAGAQVTRPPGPQGVKGARVPEATLLLPRASSRVLFPKELGFYLLPNPPSLCSPFLARCSHCPHTCSNIAKETFVPFHLMFSQEYFCIFLQIFLF